MTQLRFHAKAYSTPLHGLDFKTQRNADMVVSRHKSIDPIRRNGPRSGTRAQYAEFFLHASTPGADVLPEFYPHDRRTYGYCRTLGKGHFINHHTRQNRLPGRHVLRLLSALPERCNQLLSTGPRLGWRVGGRKKSRQRWSGVEPQRASGARWATQQRLLAPRLCHAGYGAYARGHSRARHHRCGIESI